MIEATRGRETDGMSIAALYRGTEVIDAMDSISYASEHGATVSLVTAGVPAANFAEVLHVVSQIHDHFMETFAVVNSSAAAATESTAASAAAVAARLAEEDAGDELGDGAFDEVDDGDNGEPNEKQARFE